ncbi:DUF2243 domain-containing protein [Ureibacillus acetophenoni]|uniref:Uncharacterized membrane protein n=1 Tax=Ureibacillus acetophenoni TaxID=614649 RepID=A0A285UP32_9BACL|nr:DUF2243 domain-containing protein [Ureibacillus acetophenoni]SOC43513.1 uncharacterized membrane protein [Ureibacillus acetophenoni]
MRTLNRTTESLNFWSGILFGLGAVAFIDEVIFHQLLHWHHFYDKSTTSVGLISDGLFHAFSWFATVAALFMVADLKKKNSWQKKRWFGSYILGAGVFQLYDGIIQHKLMRLHQIRYDVEIFYYDLVWNVIAAIMIVIGLIILKGEKNKTKVSEGKVAS